MIKEQGMELVLTEPAQDLLAEMGYDPQFGARPLKRVLQREVTNQLSKYLLSGEFKAGDTIYVNANKDQLSFDKTEKQPTSKPASKPERTAPKKPKAAEKKNREKDLDALKKATKDVEKAAKAIKKKEGGEQVTDKKDGE